MPDQRALPSRPSLRYLKLEAKRRLRTGEFLALHEAQLAIAREHGLPSWPALKQLIARTPGTESHALTQLRWVISRFRAADGPEWAAPSDRELRDHFTGPFLSQIPPGELIAAIAGLAAALREDLVVTGETPLAAGIRLAGLQIVAQVEAGPPHRLAGLRQFPLGSRITDTRVAVPVTRSRGDVPAAAAGIADAAFAELGLTGLVLAGGGPRTPMWAAATGWADLDRAEILETSHRFPAYQVTKLITATAVLRLIADGRAGLDNQANDYLRTLRLADETVTVRELLTHTGGVDNPAESFAEAVPDLLALYGPLLPCSGTRGAFRHSDGGYAALGQLAADLTGVPYAEAAARLVLRPLGMSGSAFPAGWPGTDAVTGYGVTPEGRFAPAPARVCTVPAAGGLWATADDLIRFGCRWSSLLPRALAREALTPQTAGPSVGGAMGLGWIVNESIGIIGHAGDGPGASASLIIPMDTSQVHIALANRRIPIEPVNARMLAPDRALPAIGPADRGAGRRVLPGRP